MPRPTWPSRLARLRRRPTVLLLVVALITTAGTALAMVTPPDPPPVGTENVTIDVPEGPGGSESLRLDGTVYQPPATPAPAVLLAHGFGGSKHSVRAEAIELARRGFVVLAWTARGFGESEGLIGLNSPDYEVADARALVN
ncbi:MAG: alpha/beta fold hydrolase, partial [Pseudonocardiaceae bacterium]